MTKVVGVRFRNVGKIYYFSPKDYEIKTGDHVIVETARGIEYGKVVLAPREVGEEDVVHPLKEVLRVATKEDDEREAQNRVREREAFKICQKKIREHGLEMKLIDAEYTFDNNKVLFYFTADGRIDFRQLVKDLAAIFKTRIELRQIGVRDETKILGGIGICTHARLAVLQQQAVPAVIVAALMHKAAGCPVLAVVHAGDITVHGSAPFCAAARSGVKSGRYCP